MLLARKQTTCENVSAETEAIGEFQYRLPELYTSIKSPLALRCEFILRMHAIKHQRRASFRRYEGWWERDTSTAVDVFSSYIKSDN